MSLATIIITPLELPEIRTNIAKFLDRSDLAQCLYVCRAWYASFLPLVWSTVSIHLNKRCPEVEALKSHSHLIRNLTYDFRPWRAYEPIHCRNVSTLHVYSDCYGSPVIAQYDQLRQLSITGSHEPRTGESTYWRPMNSFRNLSSLELKEVNIDSRSADDFWDLCTGLKSLSMRYTIIPRLLDKSIVFERLEKLVLGPMPGRMYEGLLEFIIQCPNLVYIDWSGGGPESADTFAKGVWPKLCELRIPNSIPSDKQLAQIVHGMQQVKSLNVQAREFGPLTLTALRSRFSSLRQLELQYGNYTKMGPSIIPEVFVSCPQLEILIMGEVTSEELLQEQPWVCERTLRTLHACIILSPREDMDHQQQLVLEKISRRLCHLEDFSLLYSAPGRDVTCINATLGKGLEHLANLKKLRRLGLKSRSNRMTKADVEWMLDNLKNLEFVRGDLNFQSGDSMSLATMIRKRGFSIEGSMLQRNPDDPIPPTEALVDNNSWKATGWTDIVI
ncbi:MAG: hypothetical protein J3Q66DRAFT_402782 [Benniella sp.]|nr:MAG: hypothetical protein J3Q66DRAFT_402782 [Benniella sp.]